MLQAAKEKGHEKAFALKPRMDLLGHDALDRKSVV